MDLKGKIVLLTGATSGIGRATAELFARDGATLILPVRKLSEGEKVRKELLVNAPAAKIEIYLCDLSSLSSIRNFIKAIESTYDHLDILVNNAGVFPQERQISTDGHELNFAVNYLAPVLLTRGLLNLLKKSTSSRIVNVSSTMSKQGTINFDDLESKQFGRYQAYAQSKLALVLFTKTLARELTGTGVSVNALHPGVIKTNLALGPLKSTNKILRTLFMLRMETPIEGARRIKYVATSPEVEKTSGEYFEKNLIVKLPDALVNNEVAARLAVETQKMLQLTN